jgi:hypothetical protein
LGLHGTTTPQVLHGVTYRPLNREVHANCRSAQPLGMLREKLKNPLTHSSFLNTSTLAWYFLFSQLMS